MPRQRICLVASEQIKFQEKRNGTTGASVVHTQLHWSSCAFHSGSSSSTAMVRSAPFIAASSGITRATSARWTRDRLNIVAMITTAA